MLLKVQVDTVQILDTQGFHYFSIGYTGLSLFFKSISTSLFTCSTFLFKFEQFL